MSAASLILRARAAAEALMADTCVITYVNGQVTDDYTGVVTEVRATRYSGPCKVQSWGGEVGNRVDSGEVSVIVQRPQLHLPVGTSGSVRHGDQVEILTCTLDPSLVGRKFIIRDEPRKTYMTAHRFTMEAAT